MKRSRCIRLSLAPRLALANLALVNNVPVPDIRAPLQAQRHTAPALHPSPSALPLYFWRGNGIPLISKSLQGNDVLRCYRESGEEQDTAG